MNDKLVVTDGPMKGMEGRVKWVDRHQRIAGIEVMLLGRKVMVKMGVGILKKVSDQPTTSFASRASCQDLFVFIPFF